MNGYTLPDDVVRDIHEAVRRLPPMTSEELDAVAAAFRQQDEEARQARVAARLSSSTGTELAEQRDQRP